MTGQTPRAQFDRICLQAGKSRVEDVRVKRSGSRHAELLTL